MSTFAGTEIAGPKPTDASFGAGTLIPAQILRPGRAAAIVLGSLCALLHFAFAMPFQRPEQRRHARALWLHRWCRVACRILGLRLNSLGVMPSCGLLVSNHLSYLDIIAFSALHRCVFVAKNDVARWPLFGWLAVAAGTIFVDRARRRDSARVVIEIQRAIADRLLVIVFPEGTSSGGASVLPFRSALLQSATQLECPITAAAVEYSLDSGSVSDEVCYWREMTLLPHLWNLCGKSGLVSTIRLSSVDRPARNRKRLAEQLHSLVCAIRVVGHAPFKRTIATASGLHRSQGRRDARGAFGRRVHTALGRQQWQDRAKSRARHPAATIAATFARTVEAPR